MHHVRLQHRGYRQAVTARNAVAEHVLLGRGCDRVSGVCSQHRGVATLPVYQIQFGFSATMLTLLFAIYIAVLLLTLLFFGSVSDYVGRRPVMLLGLAAGAAACGLFLIAHALVLLFGARALQGVAVGLISGTASVALLDLRPEGRAAPVVSSAAPTGGQALGAIGASALAQYALAPTRLVWWLLLAAFVIGIFVVLAIPEPGAVRVGAASSLRPHVSVSRRARGAFAAAVPGLVGLWALGASMCHWDRRWRPSSCTRRTCFGAAS